MTQQAYVEGTVDERGILHLHANGMTWEARTFRPVQVLQRGQTLHLRVQVQRVSGDEITAESVDVLGRVTALPDGAQLASVRPGLMFELLLDRVGSGGEPLMEACTGVLSIEKVLEEAAAEKEPRRFPDLVEVSEPSGIVGSLKDMSVVDVLRSMEVGKKTARLEVRPRGRPSGLVFMIKGVIIAAAWDGLVGAEAIYALMQEHRGAFLVRFGLEAPERNVNEPTPYVILEGLRRIDEQRATDPGCLSVELPPADPPPPRFASLFEDAPGVRWRR